ncbi:membrane-associated progesterone receptor component 1-like [Oppia nitens]|uniref:membrane-associated progesterone receptor component 1-like n=1 Tax=Oppia nitens TaxID=1686743 RepID=UPI0023DAE49B|nr:membrane-associated progesterone receptor component 1-like [Oppia nitens]
MSSKADIKSDSVINADDTSLYTLLSVMFGSPVNVILTVVIAYLVYRLIKGRTRQTRPESEEEVFKLPEPLPKHDMTLEELSKYDGKGADKRICIGILGKVYDCTKGHRFYGPNGPYAPLAGHDATRSLALFDVEAIKSEWDDVSDLTPYQMSSVNEWMEQFSERYDYVGRLVRDSSEKSDHIGDDDEGEPADEPTDETKSGQQ